jgi:hypothetical protein
MTTTTPPPPSAALRAAVTIAETQFAGRFDLNPDAPKAVLARVLQLQKRAAALAEVLAFGRAKGLGVNTVQHPVFVEEVESLQRDVARLKDDVTLMQRVSELGGLFRRAAA